MIKMKRGRFLSLIALFFVFLAVLSCESKKGHKNNQENINDRDCLKSRKYNAIRVLDKYKKVISKTSVSMEITYPQYYGGMYIDDAGNPVILTTDTNKRELIKKLAESNEVVVLKCLFSYQHLKNIDDKIKTCLGDKPELLENIGINTFGILSDKNCLDVSLISCTPEKIKLFKSFIIDDPCIVFSENPSRLIL